jgi:hypothetical protein
LRRAAADRLAVVPCVVVATPGPPDVDRDVATSDPLHLLVDGGEAGVEPAPQRQVVVAEDGHVAGDAQPGALGGADAADGHGVVGVHERGGPFGGVEEGLGGTDRPPLAEVGVQHRERAQPGLAQGVLEGGPAHPGVLQLRRPGDVGDAPVAQLQQVIHGHARAEPVFRRHDGYRERPRVEADHDAGHLLAFDGVQEAVVRARHHDHQPVAQLAQQVARRHAVRAVEAFRVEQQQIVALGACVRGEGADDLVQHDGAVIVDEHAQ